jgi:phospholipid N-methyltransferase
MVELADIQPMDYILEPSCGTGAIIDWILEKTREVNIKWIEYNYSNYEILLEKYQWKDYVRLENEDFMNYTNDNIFSKILMNSPFEKKQDMIHIMKAFELLKEWWILVAIAWAGVKSRTDYQEFRDFIDTYWYYEDIEQGAFKLSWTNVSTVIIYIKK